MATPGPDVANRILVLCPTGRDGQLTCDVLQQGGLTCVGCGDVEQLCREMESGAAVAVVAEEALSTGGTEQLARALERQEAWSDLPLVVFTRPGQSIDAILAGLGVLGNVTVLERPVHLTTLVSAVRSARRARDRQYQLRDLVRRLEDTDRRKDEFLAMLGHELRNPLAAIRNALQIIAQSAELDERCDRQRVIIDRQAGHLSRLVDDLLEVSRITQGKIILRRQVVDLNDVAERCVQAHARAAEAQRHTLKLSANARPVLVDGDPVRLEQILSNLLSNAIKYTPPGGRITVSIASDPKCVTLSVRDTGLGLSPEALPRIFEPFTQVQSAVDRAQGGLGLGLPLVRRLADLHGGGVEARSDGPGRGSEFVVRLPLIQGEAPHVGGPRRAAPDTLPAGLSPCQADPLVPPTARSVLVVEDNDDGRESLQELMELWGYEVQAAEDGEEALRRAHEMPPALALVDIGLPRMDGYEVARRLRVPGAGNGRTRLIAMSGYGQPEDRQRALEAGFDAYVVKPVDPDELSRLMVQLLRT